MLALAKFAPLMGGRRVVAGPTPTWRATGTVSTNTANPHPTNLPASSAVGDTDILIIALNAAAGAGSFTTPAGWTLRGGGIQTYATVGLGNAVVGMYSRVFVAGDTAPAVTWSVGGGSLNAIASVILAYTGVVGLEADAKGTEASTTTPAYLNITTLGGNRKVLEAIASGNNTCTPGSGWTERVDQASTYFNLSLDEKEFVTAGTIAGGTKTVSASSTTGKLACALFG